jgi:hypothetical protein
MDHLLQFPRTTNYYRGGLSPVIQRTLKGLLIENLDVFVFQHSDMTVRRLAEHKLNTYKGMPPIAQKKRSMTPERHAAVVSEFKKLVAAGILREKSTRPRLQTQLWLRSITDPGACVLISRILTTLAIMTITHCQKLIP